MKILEQQVEFLGEVPTDSIETMKYIEIAGRTAYQSWDNMTKGSHVAFTEKMYKSGHWPVLDHSNIVMIMDSLDIEHLLITLAFEVRGLAYLSFEKVEENKIYVAGNITAWLYVLINLNKHIERCKEDEKYKEKYAFFLITQIQHLYFSILNSLCKYLPNIFNSFTKNKSYLHKFEIVKNNNEIPNELKKFGFRIVTNRGISHEIVRHRPCAFLQESTRWIRYDDLQFVPSYEKDTNFEKDWNYLMSQVEAIYSKYGKDKVKTDRLRSILPNDIKTEIIITTDIKEYKHIIKLRSHKSAHFQFQYIAKEIEKHLQPWLS